MRSKLWISSKVQDPDMRLKWKNNLVYEIENEVVYKFESDSPVLQVFINELNTKSINYEILRIEYIFSKKDIECAEIFQVSIDETIGNAVWIEGERNYCEKCNHEIPCQKEGMMIQAEHLQGKDIIDSHPRDYSVIVSERVRKIINTHNSGNVTYLPVYDVATSRVIEGYYQIIIGMGIGDVIDPTVTIKEGHCEHCRTYDKNLLKSVMYYQRSSWNNSDIFTDSDWFGDRLNYDCGKVIMITNKLFQDFKANRVRGFSVKPAFLI